MRGPVLHAMLRWWKEHNGNGHNGNGHSRSSALRMTALSKPQTPPQPPWLAQLDREGIPRSLNYPTTTLGRLLDQAADRFGDLPALLFNGQRWTFRQMLERA